MRAWHFTDIDTPLELVDLDDPQPGPDDIVIDTGAVGLCHSDVGFLDGTITSLLGQVPIVLGHEIVGTVSAVGRDVRAFAVGDRVGVPATTDGPGTAMNGGYAEKVLVPARLPVRLPNGLSFENAVSATCAGRTAYRALHTAGRVETGFNVGLIGFGGLGYFGLQIARAAGATVYVAEIDASRWSAARELGAADCATDIGEFSDRQLDLIIDFAGMPDTLDSAVRAARHGGRIVEVGLGASTGAVSIPDITMKELTIVGSSNGTKLEASEVLDLVRSGAVVSKVSPIDFARIPDGLEALRNGNAPGRLVVVF